MTPLPGIIAHHVTVTYRNGHTALHDASFEIPTGTITALVGVNGAGKSTLFKAIMGFVPAARGEISVLGMPVREALRRNTVAYVPQAEEVDWSFPVLVDHVNGTPNALEALCSTARNIPTSPAPAPTSPLSTQLNSKNKHQSHAYHEVFINSSIGITLGSSAYYQPDQVLRDADLAMYRAKARCRGASDPRRNDLLEKAV